MSIRRFTGYFLLHGDNHGNHTRHGRRRKGGAATCVAEHAPEGKRGYFTAWIQTTATLGLCLSLLVILGVRSAMDSASFDAWGWRIPFLVSVLLLGISVCIRMSMAESLQHPFDAHSALIRHFSPPHRPARAPAAACGPRPACASPPRPS